MTEGVMAMATNKQAAGDASLAALFFSELLGAVETLGDVAEEFGQRTLTDLMYLQHAILTGGKIEVWPGETRVGEVLAKLPSFDSWMGYTELGGIWAEACERVKPAGAHGGQVTCYSGHLTHNGVRVQVDFEVAAEASQGELDAAFLKALGDKVEFDYLAIGTQ